MAAGVSDSYCGKPSYHSETRIVLLGMRGAGVSSTGNTILGREAFTVGRKTVQCERREGVVSGRQVTVIDTPGMEGYFTESISEEVKEEIMKSVSLCSPGPHAFILVFEIGAFKYIKIETIEEQLRQFGETVWRHTIVLFTRGDKLTNTTIEKYLKKDGKSLQKIVKKCRYRYHVFNNKDRSDDTQVAELLRKIEMVANINGQCFTATLDIHTLQKMCEGMERHILELRQRLEKAMSEKELQREELETAIVDLRQRLEKTMTEKEQQREELQRQIEQRGEMYEEKLRQMRKDIEERETKINKLQQALGKNPGMESTPVMQRLCDYVIPARKTSSLPILPPNMREEGPAPSKGRCMIQESSNVRDVEPQALRSSNTNEDKVEQDVTARSEDGLEDGYKKNDSNNQHSENIKGMDILKLGCGEHKVDPKHVMTEPLKEREAVPPLRRRSSEHLPSISECKTDSPWEVSMEGAAAASKEAVPAQIKTREKKEKCPGSSDTGSEGLPGPCEQSNKISWKKRLSSWLPSIGNNKKGTKSPATSTPETTAAPSSTTGSFPETADKSFPAHPASNPITSYAQRSYSVTNMAPSTPESGETMTDASRCQSDTNLFRCRKQSFASSAASSLMTFLSRSSHSVLSVMSKSTFKGSTISLPAVFL
ncbi:uncharacterized protein LOC118774544 [Megalops cyprinoides]|uniref:uncharacterized protein LOC118774544 n=1 Tax=Megalops cyprinoides TaxID=118141 RepID=UPI001864A3F4|nr:uncharacterized protein LOC118774544 [Megalops cyprinoides]